MRNPRAGGMAGLLAAAAIGWLLPAQVARGATVNFTTSVDGAQETPPTFTGAMASGTLTMDTNVNTLSYNIVISIPPPSGEISSHIHGFAPPGTPAGIKHTLPNGSPKIGVWNFVEADEASIIADLTYVNIHSNAFLGGEIRGQVLRVPSCGDTVLDGGEQCDDGNNSNGDCCDSTCQLEADGSVCDDGSGSTSNDQCTAGVCAGTLDANHYLCRQVKDLKIPAKFVPQAGISVIDQTGADTCEAKQPFLLCDPVDKNGGGITDPSLHYCCYKLKCGLKPAVNYEVTDQFWNGTVSTKTPKFLCNPCSTAPAP